MSIHMKKGKKRTEGFTLVELICVIAILGILVAIAVPSYRGIQDKSAEQVAITNARSNYTLGKAQQDMLDAGVLKNSEKEEYHFDKDSNSAYWEGQINGRTYKAYYYGDTGEAQICVDAVQRYLNDERERGTLAAPKLLRLMSLDLSNPDSPLKDYISGGQKEARIVSVKVDLGTGRLSYLEYGNRYGTVKLNIDEEGNITEAEN